MSVCDRCGEDKTKHKYEYPIHPHDEYCQPDAAFNCAVEIGDAFDGVYETDVWHGIVARHIRKLLRAEIDDWLDDYNKVINDECAPDEKHCTCVPHLRKRISSITDAAHEAAVVLRRTLNDQKGGHITFAGENVGDELNESAVSFIAQYLRPTFQRLDELSDAARAVVDDAEEALEYEEPYVTVDKKLFDALAALVTRPTSARSDDLTDQTKGGG